MRARQTLRDAFSAYKEDTSPREYTIIDSDDYAVNETLESIALDLDFIGNIMAEGLVVSICMGGGFIGSLFSGWIADVIGRRRAFQLSALLMILGASISAATKHLGGMIFGRLIVGTGMGISPSIASLYITEVSPPTVRGTFGSFVQIALCLGLTMSLFVGISSKNTFGWWRFCFWISIIPAVILILGMTFCVESPHWLYKDEFVEAEAEFEKVLGGSDVKAALTELSKLERGENIEDVKFLDLFHGRHFRVIFIGSTLYALQQLSGINAVFFFSSTVFKSAGVPSSSATACMGIANLVAVLDQYAEMTFDNEVDQASVVDEKKTSSLERGRFLKTLAVAMGIQAIAASSLVYGSLAVFLSVGGMLMFVLMFALGAGPVPGLLLPEILPGRIRAKAMAACDEFLCELAFFAFARAIWDKGPILGFCDLLLSSSDFCEE
ncbi:hypothetical protein Sjap_019975 [Stephania japonica]|uniref:Major facilitator superfamily (MFS) profile domain-containing protein n=1 Tax=Stephania japonica TaxID=461633 RepID=A0AAP0HZV9_9MAGN